MLYFRVVGRSVTVLGLVGGAPGGRFASGGKTLVIAWLSVRAWLASLANKPKAVRRCVQNRGAGALYVTRGCHGALVCHSYGPSPIQRKAGDGLQPSPGAPQEVRQGCGRALRHCRRRPRGLGPASARRGALRHCAAGGTLGRHGRGLEPNRDTRDA